VRELSCDDGYRELSEVPPNTGRDETANDVRVPRAFGLGQSREPV